MKVAITADVHLTTREKHPERYQALQAIVRDAKVQNIQHLIIAGDLFDASRQNYSEFETVCQSAREMQFTIIPGNHDPAISNKTIVASNARIITEPEPLQIDGRQFLFLPYRPEQTMGDALARFTGNLPAGEWVLIGHGDWVDGLRVPNPVEPGVYMPLTRRDVETYRPGRIFLGHIHRYMDSRPVHYVGSPCGLDITETGRRRYLVYDTEQNRIQPRALSTDIIFFDECFLVLPVQDEIGYLRQQIAARKRAWALQPDEYQKARIRIRVRGYSANRHAISELLKREFQGFTFYKGQGPDIGEVSTSTDIEKDYLAQAALASLEEMEWHFGNEEPDRDEAILAALHLIYGA